MRQEIELENVKPMDIEKRSFEIITEELGGKLLVPGTEPVSYTHLAFRQALSWKPSGAISCWPRRRCGWRACGYTARCGKVTCRKPAMRCP